MTSRRRFSEELIALGQRGRECGRAPRPRGPDGVPTGPLRTHARAHEVRALWTWRATGRSGPRSRAATVDLDRIRRRPGARELRRKRQGTATHALPRVRRDHRARRLLCGTPAHARCRCVQHGPRAARNHRGALNAGARSCASGRQNRMERAALSPWIRRVAERRFSPPRPAQLLPGNITLGRWALRQTMCPSPVQLEVDLPL